MEREQLESLLIDYIDGKLSDSDIALVQKELAENEKSLKLYEELREVIEAMDNSSTYEVPASLRTSFNKVLKEESASSPKAKVILFQPAFYRVAAAVALLITAGGIGYWISQYKQQQAEIAELRRQMEETKEEMMGMLRNQYSASQRIQGVNVALTIEKADDEVVRALTKTMNDDPNTNVRLAALDALSKFHQEPQVRRILIESLATQKDPVVQIALIQILVTMKEKGVVKDLERIVDDEETIKAVKDAAYSGLMKLS
jgi:hypothetical protein